MDDLDEFMDEVETNSMLTIPEQFDEVVDIIANEQREKGEQVVDAQERGDTKPGEEIYDETGKPFWMKFIKSDYLNESENSTYNKIVGRPTNNQSSGAIKQSGEITAQKGKINEILQKEEKLRREMEKIRKLDTELA